MTMPTVVYDLRANPITFDFATFLAGASILCKSHGIDEFDLIIVATGFRNVTPREQSYTLEDRMWRLNNLIIPAAQSCNRIKNITVVRDASNLPELNASAVYPPSFSFNSPTSADYSPRLVAEWYAKTRVPPHIFSPSLMALNLVRGLIDDSNKLVTLSPRISAYDEARNSQLKDWEQLAEKLTELGYFVLMLPDFDDALRNRHLWRSDWHILEAAAFSLDIRLAALQLAEQNIISSGGLGVLSIYSAAPYLICNLLHQENHVANAEYYKKFCDLDVGANYPWADGRQKFIWEPFSAEKIVKEHFVNANR